MLGILGTKFRHFGDQTFGGNLKPPTRKLRSRKIYLTDILENKLNLRNFFFSFRLPCPLILRAHKMGGMELEGLDPLLLS